MSRDKKWQTEVGARLRQAREQASLRLEDIAQACGVTPQSVHYWETGKSPAPSYAFFKVAQLTGADLNWLLGRKSRASPAIEIAREGIDVPVIEWGGLQDIEAARQTAMRTVSARNSNGPRAFALTVRDKSNAPALQPGDICVFDPDVKPEPGRYVLVLLGRTREPKIREYAEASDHVILTPTNEKWKPDRLTSKASGEILATMTEFSRSV